MRVFPESARSELKKPLGELSDLGSLMSKFQNRKLIAVGDVIVLSLLEKGIRPFISVYDFQTMRKGISAAQKEKLGQAFPNALLAENPAGGISEDLEKKCKQISKNGGAILVKGEEDLATLVFMRLSIDNSVILYGQPNQGVVAVECTKESREKAEQLFKMLKEKT
jgi:uncharacterized protein (UPF0218 family)